MTARSTRTSKRSRPARPAAPAAATELDADLDVEVAPAPRTGAKRTVLATVAQLPNYVRLLGGLLRDRRVSGIDKLLVVGAIAYILSPLDFIPDFIPFLGQVDDIFLLVTAVSRLITNAGRRVVLMHWKGDPAELDVSNLRNVLGAAAFFLPRGIRRRLRRRF